MSHQISKVTKLIAAIKPSTAETTLNSASTIIDMSGWRSIRVLAMLGASTGDALTTLSITGASSTSASFSTLQGQLVGGTTQAASVVTTTGQGGGLLAIDVRELISNPRYVKANIHRNAANANHGGVIVELYDPVTVPTTDDSTSMLQAQVIITQTT